MDWPSKCTLTLLPNIKISCICWMTIHKIYPFKINISRINEIKVVVKSTVAGGSDFDVGLSALVRDTLPVDSVSDSG